MIPEPYKFIAELVGILTLIAGLFFWGFHTGEKKERTAQEALQNTQAAAQFKAYQEADARANALASQLEVEKTKRKAVYETISKGVTLVSERVVYRNICIDDDGLRLVNAALAGGAATDSGGFDAALPASGAASGAHGR